MPEAQEESANDRPETAPLATGQAAYHLLLDADEAPVTRTALELLIDDATHESGIRGLARGALEQLPESGTGTQWPFSLPLEPGQMKIVHTALHLLLDDLQRDQDAEIQILHRILGKLPDEHAIRAIRID